MLVNTEFTRRIDVRLTQWMSKYGILLLRISVGLIFLWFGLLKFFPGASPAEGLAVKTIQLISFNLLNSETILIVLAIWESLIGLGLITGIFLRETLLLLFVQMIGTMTPIVLFPGEVFRSIPFILTLEGQYIFKNLVVISAGIVLGATVRGGRIIPEPEKNLRE
jgi:uncharacterized membrane protein YphA (DoxX/SURF4 family)